MQINEFKIQVLNDYKIFTVLDKIDGSNDSIFLFKDTPSGREEITLFQAFKMADNKVLICFLNNWQQTSDYNYIAVSNGVEELFTTQIFERIEDIYSKTRDGNGGAFMFCNSLPILLDVETGRCDNTTYGPINFTKNGSYPEKLIVDDVKNVLVYENILSINGIGHIFYINYKNQEVVQDAFNNWEIPNATQTLMELLKLMVEWKQTVGEPFNNTDPIAVRADEFLNKLEISNDLIEHIENNQVPMQVAKYLYGDFNARQQPADVMPLTSEVETWLMSKMCFTSVTGLLNFYPTMWDKNEILSKEKELFEVHTRNTMLRYGINYQDNTLDDIDYCVNTGCAFVQNQELRPYLTMQFNMLKSKRNLLNR